MKGGNLGWNALMVYPKMVHRRKGEGLLLCGAMAWWDEWHLGWVQWIASITSSAVNSQTNKDAVKKRSQMGNTQQGFDCWQITNSSPRARRNFSDKLFIGESYALSAWVELIALARSGKLKKKAIRIFVNAVLTPCILKSCFLSKCV